MGLYHGIFSLYLATETLYPQCDFTSSNVTISYIPINFTIIFLLILWNRLPYVCVDLICECLWLKQLVYSCWTYWKITQLGFHAKKEGERLKIQYIPAQTWLLWTALSLMPGKQSLIWGVLTSCLLHFSLSFSLSLSLMLLSHASCFHNTLDMHLIKPSLFLMGESLHYSRDVWGIMIELFRWGSQSKDSTFKAEALYAVNDLWSSK